MENLPPPPPLIRQNAQPLTPPVASAAAAPEAPPCQHTCPLCLKWIVVQHSRAGKPLIRCSDCNIIYMIDSKSLQKGGVWIWHPIIENGQVVFANCPTCSHQEPVHVSASTKNLNARYIKCEPCDTFWFTAQKFYFHKGQKFNLDGTLVPFKKT